MGTMSSKTRSSRHVSQQLNQTCGSCNKPALSVEWFVSSGPVHELVSQKASEMMEFLAKNPEAIRCQSCANKKREAREREIKQLQEETTRNAALVRQSSVRSQRSAPAPAPGAPPAMNRTGLNRTLSRRRSFVERFRDARDAFFDGEDYLTEPEASDSEYGGLLRRTPSGRSQRSRRSVRFEDDAASEISATGPPSATQYRIPPPSATQYRIPAHPPPPPEQTAPHAPPSAPNQHQGPVQAAHVVSDMGLQHPPQPPQGASGASGPPAPRRSPPPPPPAMVDPARVGESRAIPQPDPTYHNPPPNSGQTYQPPGGPPPQHLAAGGMPPHGGGQGQSPYQMSNPSQTSFAYSEPDADLARAREELEASRAQLAQVRAREAELNRQWAAEDRQRRELERMRSVTERSNAEAERRRQEVQRRAERREQRTSMPPPGPGMPPQNPGMPPQGPGMSPQGYVQRRSVSEGYVFFPPCGLVAALISCRSGLGQIMRVGRTWLEAWEQYIHLLCHAMY